MSGRAFCILRVVKFNLLPFHHAPYYLPAPWNS